MNFSHNFHPSNRDKFFIIWYKENVFVYMVGCATILVHNSQVRWFWSNLSENSFLKNSRSFLIALRKVFGFGCKSLLFFKCIDTENIYQSWLLLSMCLTRNSSLFVHANNYCTLNQQVSLRFALANNSKTFLVRMCHCGTANSLRTLFVFD